MSNDAKITVIKGKYKNFKISNTTFPLLKPVETFRGHSTALIDASSILGEDFTRITVELEDYRCQ